MNCVQKGQPRLWAVVLTSLLLMASLDYFTGQELAFSCAYLLPVSLAAWWLGRRATIAMSVVCGLTALVVDELDGLDYSYHAIEYWNAFTCFLISLVTGLVLLRLRETLMQKKIANEELQQALASLEASTAEIRKLQSGLQVVCAWTKRIKVDEQWMTPEEFMSDRLHLNLSHGISPEAYEKVDADWPHAA